jgi:TolB protein
MDAPARVTDERSIVVSPRWRPDARGILFTSYRQHMPRLFQVTLANRQVAPARGRARHGARRRVGARRRASRGDARAGGNSDIFITDASGQASRRITDHWGIDVSPAWSPTGGRSRSARRGAAGRRST